MTFAVLPKRSALLVLPFWLGFVDNCRGFSFFKGSWQAVHPCLNPSLHLASAVRTKSLLAKPEIAGVYTKLDVAQDDEKIIEMLKGSWTDGRFKKYGMNTKNCNSALLQLAKSNLRNKVALATSLFRYMVDQSETRFELKPDLLSINSVLTTLSRSTPSDTAQLADDIVQEWKTLYRDGRVDRNLDTISYNLMLTIHTRAKNFDRAEDILSEMKVEGDEPGVFPDAVSYTILMHGYALEGNVQKVESLYKNMQKAADVVPTVECFNEILFAHSLSKSPGRAEESLKLCLENAEYTDIRPDIRSFNIVIHALSLDNRPGAITRAERLFNRMPKRDSVSYSTLISSYCNRLSSHVAIEATEKAFNRAWTDPDFPLDSSLISNVLFALASVDDKEMPRCAERLVEASVKRGVPLDIRVYNALIHCWARSGDYEAARRARQILLTVERNTKLRPNLKTYTNVLDCFAKSRENISLEFAKRTIQKMERKGPKPNVHAYTALIQNFARSKIPYKAVEASRVLQKMKTSSNPGARPNILSYNAVLNAAEHSDPTGGAVTEEALKVACQTFEEIQTSSVAANHVTYGSFLGVLAKLMPSSSRQEIVGLVFRRACKEGQVSPLVVRKLNQALESSSQVLALMEGYDEESIPEVWRVNVRDVRARDAA